MLPAILPQIVALKTGQDRKKGCGADEIGPFTIPSKQDPRKRSYNHHKKKRLFPGKTGKKTPLSKKSPVFHSLVEDAVEPDLYL